MSGKNLTELTDVNSLTVDDLRCIAIFLSNFYVPFSTSLDDTSEDSNTKAMQSSLMSIGFKQDAAEQLISGVYQASLSSASELYIKVDDIKDFNSGFIGFGDDEKDPGVDLNSTLYTEGYKKVVGETVDGYTPMTAFLWNAIVNHNFPIVFYQNDSGTMKPCFAINNKTMQLLARFLEDSSVGSNGIAMNAVINLASYNEWDTLNDNEKAKMTAPSEKIYVDWVGNIIYDAGDRRIVLYPSCINPYTFTKISDSTADVGLRFNLVSSWGMYLANSDSATYADDSVSLAGISKTINMRAYRSTSKKATWDSANWSWGKGTAGDIKNFWGTSSDSFCLGLEVGTNDDWASTKITYKADSININATDSITTMVKYKSITDAELDALTNSEGSVFVTANLCSSDLINSAFTSKSKFATSSSDINSYISYGSSEKNLLTSFFLTYAFAYANKDKTEFNEATDYVDMKFNDCFPAADTNNITWETPNMRVQAVTDLVYYFLHPSEGLDYVATWFKNKFSAITLRWHNDIVGSTDSNSSTGMTKYLGFSGYATSPSLYDIEWTAKLLEHYNNFIVYIIIFMCVVMLCYLMLGSLSLQRATLGVVIFGTLAFIPPVAINVTIDKVNTLCDTIYGTKFDFWAMCQLQQYIGDLDKVKNVSNTEEYVAQLMNIETGGVDSTTSFTGTRLKWMSPKKFNELNATYNELNNSTISDTFSDSFVNILISSMASNNKSEDYTDCVGETYLYRDACDIYRYTSIGYELYNSFNFGDSFASDNLYKFAKNKTDTNGSNYFSGQNRAVNNLSDIKYSSGKEYLGYFGANEQQQVSNISADALDTSSLNAIRRGFLFNTIGLEDSDSINNINYFTKDTLATTYITAYSDTISTIHSNLESLKSLVESDAVLDLSRSALSRGSSVYGLSPSNFNLALNDILQQNTTPSRVQLSGFYYSLFAESPFYYFNFNLRDQYNATGNYAYNYNDLTSGTEFYHLLLDRNQEYFFNLSSTSGSGYGELRDFMNMHDLFYYVIPLLTDGNEAVDLFDEVFGMNTNDDCSLRLDSSGKFIYDGITFDNLASFCDLKDEDDRDCDGDTTEYLYDTYNQEQQYKLWHDYNVWTLFNNYTTWLDTMQDCNYTKSETINVMGDKFRVLNPLDPTSYYEANDSGEITKGRYMIFSRSEMAYYGLTESDLTTVEQKIINIQDAVYEQSLDLMNYYKLSDEVLLESMSMIQLFEFNKEFSQSSIVGKDYILYPQGYELKAFTYDAYLRLIVAQASGEPIMSDDNRSIYMRVMENTSLFFGIILLLNDFVAVYIVPILKIVFIILIFFVSILVITGAAIKLEFSLANVLYKSLLAPLLAYFAVGVGLAWLVSLFMSSGASGVTKTSSVISVGDPTTALFIMLVINLATMILYFKIVKKSFNDFKTYFQIVTSNIGAHLGGAVATVTGAAIAGKTIRSFRNKTSDMRVSSTASQRGRENASGVGKNAPMNSYNSSSNTGLSKGVKPSTTKDSSKKMITPVGMNRYDKKAYDSANARADKARAKLDSADRKLSVAKANNLPARKVKRLENAQKKALAKYNKASGHAKNIATLGRIGATKKRISSIGKKATTSNLGRFAGNTINKINNTANTSRPIITSQRKGSTKVVNKTTNNTVNKTTNLVRINGGVMNSSGVVGDNTSNLARKKAKVISSSLKSNLDKERTPVVGSYTRQRQNNKPIQPK